MANNFEEGMAHATKKGFSFFDWDGLDNEEFDKLNKIMDTSNKSSGVELLYEDDEVVNTYEEDVESSGNSETQEEEVEELPESEVQNVVKNVEEDIRECEEEEIKECKENIPESAEEKIPEIAEEKIPEIEEGVEVKGRMVDIKNSVLHPTAPVFQPSIPPPSMMPFPIAVPHWAAPTHHHPHSDPNIQQPPHGHPHHHHQAAGHHYSYAVPGGYVFHPHHDPNLAATAHHHNPNEAATVACFVTLSNGQPAYTFPGHQPIPAHHPHHHFQSNTLAGSGSIHTSQMSNNGPGHHHHIPTHQQQHPLIYPPHQHIGAATTIGQQPLPAHMVPPNTVSQQAMPHLNHHHHHHHQQQQQQQHHSTQFIYMPDQQEQVPPLESESISSSTATTVEEGSSGQTTDNACDYIENSSVSIETNNEPLSLNSSHEEKKDQASKNSDNNINASVIPTEKEDSPSKHSLADIEFGGPVVFDSEPQPVTNSSSLEKTPSKSPNAKSKSKKSPSPSSVQKKKSARVLTSSSSPSQPKDCSAAGPVTETSSSTSQSQSQTETIAEEHVHNSHVNKDSNVNSNHSSNVNTTMQSYDVNKDTTPVVNNVNSSSSSSSSPSTDTSAVNKITSSPSSNVDKSLPDNHSSVAKEEQLPEANGSNTSAPSDETNLDAKSKDSNDKPPQHVSAPTPTPAPAPAPAAPKTWSSLFGNKSQNVPSQGLSSNTSVQQQHPLVNNVEPSQNSGVATPSTSVRYWQEQDKQKEREKSNPLSINKIKAVGVRQDPLASKLLGKLSNFPISYIPIILQPRGLKNGRNICFMNATLQVLMGCAPFIHLFRAFRNLPSRSGGNSSTPVFDALVQFVNSFEHCQRVMKQGAASKKGNGYDINVGVPFIPDSLLAVAQHILGLNIGVQHDAEEFLSQILSICNEEVESIIKMKNMDSLNNNNTPSPSIKSNSKKAMGNGTHHHHHQNGDVHNHINDGGNDEDDGDDSWVQVGPKNHCVETNVNNCGQTPLSAIFAGLSRSCLVRESGKSSDTLDSFFTLKLDIQADSIRTVRDALVRLNATEDVHDVDGRKVNGHRRMFFDELPPVLIMHLKLFKYANGNGQKIQKNISFDIHLQIPKEILSRVGKSKYQAVKSRSYKLFGVVNHHGTKMNDGHYTSDVFLPIVNGWLHFDDSDVTLSDESTVLKHVDKSMPYLLFYRRMDV